MENTESMGDMVLIINEDFCFFVDSIFVYVCRPRSEILCGKAVILFIPHALITAFSPVNGSEVS